MESTAWRSEVWLEKKKDRTPPKGHPGKPIEYALSRWPIIRYLENGYITTDSNAVENAIRPLAVARVKNRLFEGAPAGVDAAATLYSLIQTARARGFDPCRRPRVPV